jgi:Ca-activated chloride channel family protein
MGALGQAGVGGGQFGMMGAFGNLGGQFGLKGAPAVPPGKAKTPAPSTHWRSGGTSTDKTQPTAPAREPKTEPTKVLDFARALRQAGYDGDKIVPLAEGGDRQAQEEAKKRLDTYLKARQALLQGQQSAVQTGQLGVDLSLEVDRLRRQGLVDSSGQRKAAGREFQLLAGIWIDRDFKEKTPAVVVKAMSDAYFRILERVPEAKDVFRLGNRLIWMTPGGKALVIDESDGKDKLDDKEIDQLFAKK